MQRLTGKLNYAIGVCWPRATQPSFFVFSSRVRAKKARAFTADLGLLVYEMRMG